MSKSFKNKGLTLIEILIALAMISIAFSAIILTTSQTIRNTSYLQNKMVAAWVGLKIVNEIRSGIIKSGSDQISGQTELLGKKWFWKAIITSTPNPKILKVVAHVALAEKEKSMIDWTSYVYQN